MLKKLIHSVNMTKLEKEEYKQDISKRRGDAKKWNFSSSTGLSDH